MLGEDRNLSDELFREAAKTIGLSQIFEISALIGYYELLARQLRVFQVGSPESGLFTRAI
jgi:hypothetical protein